MSEKPTSTPKKSTGNRPVGKVSKRRAILVLGMHRSGTSAVTRVLSLLGCDLPKVIMGKGEGNDTGHWEPERLVALHDALLMEAGSRWDDFRPLSLTAPSIFANPDTLQRVRNQIQEDYGDSRILLLKDPRISRFLPMYQNILADMQIQPMAVLVLRNPLAVIRSLVARKATPVHSMRYASLMWLRHMIDAERESRSLPRVLISYEQLLEDWRGTMARVEETLKLGLPVNNDDTGRKVSDFLSDDLSHHHFTDAALERSETVSTLVKRAYKSLQLLSFNGQDCAARDEMDRISTEFDTAIIGVGTAIYEEFAEQNENLNLAYCNAMKVGHGHFLRTLELQEAVEVLNGTVLQKTTEVTQLASQAVAVAGAQSDALSRAETDRNLLFETREKAIAIYNGLEKRDSELKNLLRGQQEDTKSTLAALIDELVLLRNSERNSIKQLTISEAALRASQTDVERLQVLNDGREQVLAALQDAFVEAKNRAEAIEMSTTEESELTKALLAQQKIDIASVTASLSRAEIEAELHVREEIDELKRQLTGKIQTLEKHAVRIELQRSEIDYLKGLTRNLSEQLQSVQTSASWRLTQPVRAVATGFPGATKIVKRIGRVGGYIAKGEFSIKLGEWQRAKQLARTMSVNHFDTAPSQVAPASPASSPPMVFAKVDPLVSVVILNLNKPELTLQSVAAVLEHSDMDIVEVIVVDNGSAYANYMQLTAGLPAIAKIIRVDVNRYFSEGNNIGAEAAQGRFLVFLNNDAFVTANWLQPMLDVFKNYPNVGGVGPKFVYPDGRLQEVGARVSADGTVEQLGKFSLPDPTILTEVREIDYSSAACFLMERKQFLELGGFDMMYEPAYYEDVDLCLKLRSNGKKLYCNPFSTVVHLENATSSDDSNRALQLNTIVELNRRKFVARWAEWFAHPHSIVYKAMKRPIATHGDAKGRTAAVYTPYNLIPGGGERYLLQMTEVLSHHCDVVIVTEHQYSAVRIREMLRDFGIPQFTFSMMLRRDITEPFDIAVILGNEALPSFGNLGNKNFYICQFPFPMNSQTINERQTNLLRFERTIVYSGFARDCLAKAVAEINVASPTIDVIAPAVGGLEIPGKTLPVSGKIKILSIGRFFAGGHNKRHDVLIEATIALAKLGVPVELSLIGSVHAEAEHRARYRELVAIAEGHPITFYPDAAPKTVDALLKASHIYCHATGFGVNVDLEPHRCEHFGISVVEGMRAGAIPFVVANGGPASIVVDKITGFHYSNVDELVNGIVGIIANPDEYAKISRAAHAAALQFDTTSFQQRWEHLFASADTSSKHS